MERMVCAAAGRRRLRHGQEIFVDGIAVGRLRRSAEVVGAYEIREEFETVAEFHVAIERPVEPAVFVLDDEVAVALVWRLVPRVSH